jgi:hypothetical protein
MKRAQDANLSSRRDMAGQLHGNSSEKANAGIVSNPGAA